MLYLAYQAHTDLIEPAKTVGPSVAGDARRLGRPEPTSRSVRNLSAAYELIARAGLTHARPDYGIPARHGRQPRGRGHRGGGADAAVRHAAAFQEGHRHRAAARAGRGAAVGPLRHAAAQHRAHAAARPRRLHHRLAQRARRAARRRAPSASTTMSTTSSSSWRSWARARTSSPSASPACRRSPPSP